MTFGTATPCAIGEVGGGGVVEVVVLLVVVGGAACGAGEELQAARAELATTSVIPAATG
jgi:hypothetical protein